jgi:hypothetical protein
MADQEPQSSTNKFTKRGDGSALEQSDAARNPMKRTMDTSQEHQSHPSTTEEPKKAPVVRGDGTVLPERSPDQPQNPMKRTMDTAHEQRDL